MTLIEKYPPSKPCSCEKCRLYCLRPGWWTVEEATRAIEAGFQHRMMVEMAPGLKFGVLSPAFRGCEGSFAQNQYAKNGCNFLTGGLCEIHGTDLIPLECRFCHHDREGQGAQCHADIEKEWNTPEAQKLIGRWGKLTGFWERFDDLLKNL